MYIPYNSRKDYHKSKFGAVREDDNVVFRIVMPRHFSVSAAYLAVCEEFSREKKLISMEWERMEGDSEEWWRVEFTPRKAGLYFYHFEYDTPFGRSVILCQKEGCGYLNTPGREWQLTVFQKDFTCPQKFKGGIIYQIFPDRFNFSGKEKKDIPEYRILNFKKRDRTFCSAALNLFIN